MILERLDSVEDQLMHNAAEVAPMFEGSSIRPHLHPSVQPPRRKLLRFLFASLSTLPKKSAEFFFHPAKGAPSTSALRLPRASAR